MKDSNYSIRLRFLSEKIAKVRNVLNSASQRVGDFPEGDHPVSSFVMMEFPHFREVTSCA